MECPTGLELATTCITIWGSTIELRPPVNRNLLLCNLLETEYCSLFQIALTPNFELYLQKPAQASVQTGRTQTSLGRCSKLIPNRRQGAFRLHAFIQSIMDLGLENF